MTQHTPKDIVCREDSIFIKDHIAKWFLQKPIELPIWPPDVFAVTANILLVSETYPRVVEIDAKINYCPKPEETIKIGEQWFRNLILDIALEKAITPNAKPHPLKKLRKWWRNLVTCEEKIENDLSQDVFESLINLFLAADEASKNISLAAKGDTCEAFLPSEKIRKEFLGIIEETLHDKNNHLSLCRNISYKNLRVLPKSHTPDCGMTLRSISHYLALLPGLEVQANWVISVPKEKEQLNLLLIPWPLTMQPSDFTPATLKDNHLNKSFGYFKIKPPEYPAFKKNIELLIAATKVYTSKIHGLIMPELSLSKELFLQLQEVAKAHNLFLCAGLTDEQKNTNTLVWNLFEEELSLINESQSKHHRWSMDANQLQRYGLCGFLDPNKRWWEYMKIEKRKLHFFNYGLTTICTLICEDLARQDPTASIIRAVAPNLVIALLMDGPQLANRWPARYASILADDPGCAVLSLTSYGLIGLSNKTLQNNDSRVVALWRDKMSDTKEISLEKNEQALLLTLTPTERQEVSADGRAVARYPVLVYSGHHGLTLPDGIEKQTSVRFFRSLTPKKSYTLKRRAKS